MSTEQIELIPFYLNGEETERNVASKPCIQDIAFSFMSSSLLVNFAKKEWDQTLFIKCSSLSMTSNRLRNARDQFVTPVATFVGDW